MPSADWSAPTATGPVDARVVLPGSKSLTNRYLVLAALASDVSRLRAPLRSRDTLLMAAGPAHPRRRCRRRRRRRLAGHPGPARRRRHGRLRAGRQRHAVRAAGGRASPTGRCGSTATRTPGLRPMAPVLGALRTLGVAGRRRRARRPAVHRPRPRVGARRGGHPRRLGVLAVRLRPAPVRRALRRGRHRAPRRHGACRACRTSR